MRPYNEMIDYLKGKEIPTVKNNKQIEYLNIEAGFDIETTSSEVDGKKVAFMYVWMMAIEYKGDTFYGRTWEEFLDLCSQLQEHYGLSEDKRLVVYVHNLGYEFQFMRKYFDWLDVFSASERKPIKALSDMGIEFRDSYILSGYSLANTAKNLAKHKIKKMEGDLDYSLVRHHETPLTDEEIGYCVNDVQIILAYINEQIEHCGDVSMIPMTNTGRVRKYVRDACYYKRPNGTKGGKGQYTKYRKIMEDLTLETDTYNMLKRSFMGGFTHANGNYVGDVLEGVTSIDFTSSYPSVMLSEKFPMSRFKDITIRSERELDTLMNNYAVVLDIRLTGVKSKLTQEDYISESKCKFINNPVVNNGRVNSADALEITITDVDYQIMKQVYDWETIHISTVKYAHKGYLPKSICHSILALYQDKTQLKDVEGSEVEYLLSKGMLNSVYGMCVTDVVKTQAVYDADGEWVNETPDVDDEIESYNGSRNRFLYYAWGVWITAYARKNLWTGIIAVGDDYVYSDTDSLKLLNYENHKPYINWFDGQIKQKMESMCEHHRLDKKLLEPKTKNNVKKLLGVWDYEGTYKKFKTLGAKRYMIEKHTDNEIPDIEITVAGLSKQSGIEYMLEVSDYDSDAVFEMFDNELYIPADRTGKMTHSYLDNEHEFSITDYEGNEAEISTLSSAHLENCSFTLSISRQFNEFLQQLGKGYIYKGLDFV